MSTGWSHDCTGCPRKNLLWTNIVLVYTQIHIMHISEHSYGLPSTVDSLGRKLTATNQSMTSLINNNTVLKSQKTKLKKKVKSLQQALTLIQELYPTLLKELDEHVETMGSHRNLMVKKIVGCFVAMRSKHFCKQFNRQTVKVRVQLSKLISFKNQ